MEQRFRSIAPNFRDESSGPFLRIVNFFSLLFKPVFCVNDALKCLCNRKHVFITNTNCFMLFKEIIVVLYCVVVGQIRGKRQQESGENYIKRSLMICIPHPILCG